MNEQASKYIHRHRSEDVVPIGKPDYTDHDVVFEVHAQPGVPIVINLGGKSFVVTLNELTDHVYADVKLFDDYPDAAKASEFTSLEATPPSPMGVFGMISGRRYDFDETGFQNYGWDAVTTVTLLAQKGEVES